MPDKLAVIQSEETIKELERIDNALINLVGNFKLLSDEITKISNGFTKGTPKEYMDSLNKMQGINNDLAKTQQEIIKIESKLADIRAKTTKETLNEAKATEALAKADAQRAKQKAIEQQQEIRNNREAERKAKLAQKEEARLKALESTYAKVEAKLKSLQIEYRDLATKKDLSIKMTDKEIQRMEFLEKKIQKYDTTLKAVDASMGKFQRNVGNYKNTFNPLSNSINQLTREAPAFAVSMQTGFLALSNNIPVFFDAIEQAKNKTKALREEGQKAPGVFKQLVSSFFSWNTAISVGVTLLTVYGKEIGEFISNLFKGKESIDNLKVSQEHLNKAIESTDYKNAIIQVEDMRIKFDLAKKGAMDKEKVLKLYNDTLGKTTGEATSLNQAEELLAKNADNYIKATLYKATANLALEEASKKALEAEQNRLKKESDFRNITDGLAFLHDSGDGRGAERALDIDKNEAKRRKDKEYNELKDQEKNSIDIAKEFMKKATEASKGLNFDFGWGNDKKATHSTRLPKEVKNALDNITAERDNALAKIKDDQIEGLINEEDYWTKRMEITENYLNKIQKLLDNSKANQNKLEASIRKKAIEEKEKTLNELYDIQVKKENKINKRNNERLTNEKVSIKDDGYITETERVTKLIQNHEKTKEEIQRHYEELLNIAKKYKQDETEIIEEYNDKINSLDNERNALNKDISNAYEKDLNYKLEILEAVEKTNSEEEKALILTNSKLPKEEKTHLIKLIELNTQKKINAEKIKELTIAIKLLEANQNLTLEERKKLEILKQEVAILNSENANIDQNINDINIENVERKLGPIRDIIANSFKNLGLDTVANEFNVMFDAILKGTDAFGKKFEDETQRWMAVASAGVAIIADFGKKLVEEQKQERLRQIDEEINRTSEQTNMEISFINKRLDAYSNLNDLTAEQLEERNALEDEARTIKEQQAEREKMLNAQKLKAEQKAKADQALIDGAVGSVKALATYGPTPVGFAAAFASIAFAALQASFIASKNPIPKYFVGRKGGTKEIAWTQEKGAEMITDKYGNIKTLGSDTGAVLTQLEAGDSVYTANETKNILKNMPNIPVINDEIIKKITMKNIPIIYPTNDSIDYDKLATKIGQQNERIAKKYDKINVYEENGIIYKQQGGQIPVKIGRKIKKSKPITRINYDRN